MRILDPRPPRRARYRDAIDWMALNGDTEWLRDNDDELIPSVTASLVADLFGRTTEEMTADLRRALHKQERG